jgi:hypothetical protein
VKSLAGTEELLKNCEMDEKNNNKYPYPKMRYVGYVK